ncbi:heterogeneous nuclear ribonucleoprotein Q-like, partial [Cicer arietinum]
MEEMDDDGGEDDNAEGSVEEHEYEESAAAEAGRKDQFLDAEKSDLATEEDGQKPSLIDEEEKEKPDELLALPPHGSEVFIGELPRDTCEDDLRELCEPMGDIVEVRLMKDMDTRESKGYAFCGAFKTKEVAEKATESLHSKEFKVFE